FSLLPLKCDDISRRSKVRQFHERGRTGVGVTGAAEREMHAVLRDDQESQLLPARLDGTYLPARLRVPQLHGTGAAEGETLAILRDEEQASRLLLPHLEGADLPTRLRVPQLDDSVLLNG